MSVQQLLASMCADLPDADLNAIRKARGFSASETASRTSFANFYTTAVGLDGVFHLLSAEENFTLSLLHESGEVDIAFFERLYGAGNQHGTYTQRYKPTFDIVKKNLVRRGLVVMAEVKMRGETVALQHWRFALPAEFVPHLLPLPSIQKEQAGQVNERFIRQKLLQIISGTPEVTKASLAVKVEHGSLYLNGQFFLIAALREWQITIWEHELKVFKPNVPASLSPIEAALKLLCAENWMNPIEIEPALKIYCFGGKTPPAEQLLRKGWDFGLLSRLEINSVQHYRLAPAPMPILSSHAYPSSLDWADTAFKSGYIKIDLNRIPLPDLELLNRLTHLAVENGALIASPSLIKLGRASSTQRNSMLSQWFAERVPAFGEVLATVNAKWGKTILHENLLFARVRDLSLRVQLERELKDNIVVLSEHFIAFPLEARASVEKVLKKTGFVVKTVKPS